MRGARLGPIGCVAVAVVAAACGRAWVPTAEASASGGDGPPVEQVWLRDCAVCHGEDAHGTNRGPSLEGVGRATTDYMVSTGRMPIDEPDDEVRRGPVAYSPATVAALVDHVAELVPGGPDIPELPPADDRLGEGGALYRAQCAACHAWSGGGGALLEREAPSLHAATPVQVAEAMRIGPGTMPAFGEAALSDEEAAAVVAYVEYLDQPRDVGGQPLWHLGPLAEGAVAWVVGIGALLLVARRVGTSR